MFDLYIKEKKLWVWENAEVIFLKKEGKKTYSAPGSYRPISITAYLGKLLEKIKANRLKKFLLKKNINDPDQEGFTEGKNTIRYLNRLHLGIKSDTEKGKTVICLFIDFEKAFDSVWKKGLLVKLSKLGVRGNFLKLIDHFLTSRKVNLKVNGDKGNKRNCDDFGLPQGSVLSPILFRIYMLDLLEELEDEDIVIYKFADDGTMKISCESTEQCLLKLQRVLDAVNSWAKKWRMIINCLPNKTEVICFSTAENNRNLIPKEFKLGEKRIKLVKHTKVLGVIFDEDLNFIEQSKDVYNKLMRRWIMICRYSNRNWGFTQRVMIQLINSLFLSCLFYGSHIWMKKQNMKEINGLHYKIMKSSIGAVFNVRQSVCEVILGLPPIMIQNEINQVKHFLKINQTEVPEDQLKELIKENTSRNIRQPTELYIAMKRIFKFLKWKLINKSCQFTENDEYIINQKDFSKFHSLSQSSCKYTKDQIKRYTELLWSESLTNEFMCDGYDTIPVPRCSPLPLDRNLPRKSEVMLMQMFYEQNLLNSFIYKIGRPEIPSPLCHCGKEEQTSYHLVLNCDNVDSDLRDRAAHFLNMVVGEIHAENSLVLLNASRDKQFMDCLVQIIEVQKHSVRDEIDLN